MTEQTLKAELDSTREQLDELLSIVIRMRSMQRTPSKYTQQKIKEVEALTDKAIERITTAAQSKASTEQ